MPIFAQVLNGNNLKSVSENSMKMQANRKLIKYSFKKCIVKAMFILTVFTTLLLEGRTISSLVQQGTGSERDKFQ